MQNLIYALLPTPLGQFTLCGREDALCGVSFPAEQTAAQLRTRVELPAHPLLAEAGRQLLEYLAGSRRHFQLPLSTEGTSFQERVWEQLCTIPYGQTLTYGELAERLGGRQYARAVGGAAHCNPLAIIIPCHRLIGAGGRLTGFGGGLGMKQTLLELEAAADNL